MTIQSKPRRVSYVIPPPQHQPPHLVLPPLDTARNGTSGPIVIPQKPGGEKISLAQNFVESAEAPRNPQHRLGITSLALDTSTVLSGRPTPEGILYSGGKDGLVVAWEQAVPMQRRKARYGREEQNGRPYHSSRWEPLTGWSDGEEDSDEDIYDESEATESSTELPYEDRWHPDYSNLTEHKSAVFRQCAQAHTDWINDIVLCNYNQTLLSASNDGTIKAWNPHATVASDLAPSVIGSHADYVRCLALSRERQWVASGSFDQTIRLWDVQNPHAEPLTTLALPESTLAAKGSIYALATDPLGHVIVSGSPERVVRVWDPRSAKRTSKLVGHTDNIRGLLISEDGRYVLSGSSDRSIKLWSLTAQRCLHTFAHHTDSVWSLFSNHPSLEIFYSGDRSGIVCKVDVEGCADISEGECAVICRDTPEADEGRGSEGINKIVAMDDLYVWTATGSSSIKRWVVPPRRVLRVKELEDEPNVNHYMDSPISAPLPYGLSPASTSPVITRGSLAGSKRDSAGISLHDIASQQLGRPDSPSSLNRGPSQTRAQHRPRPSTQSVLSNTSFHSSFTIHAPGAPEVVSSPSTLLGLPFQSLVRLASLNDPYFPNPTTFPRQRPTRDTDIATLYSAASIRSGNAGHQAPLISALRATQTDGLNSSSPPSINSPKLTLPLDHMRDPALEAAREAYEDRELAVDAMPLNMIPNDIIKGSHGLVRSVILNDRLHALTVDTAGEVALWDLIRGICLGVFTSEEVGNASINGSSSSDLSTERNPREALETVRERIEGEAMCPSWSTVDTKVGHLTVHLNEGRCFDAEAYVDETIFLDGSNYPEEHKVNIGKWVLSNLFAAFVREEIRLVEAVSKEATDFSVVPADPRAPPSKATKLSRGLAPTHINLEPPSRRLRSVSDLTNAMRSPGNAALGTPALTPAVLSDIPPVPPLPVGTSQAPPTTKPSAQTLKERALSTIPQSPPTASTQAESQSYAPLAAVSTSTAKTPNTVGSTSHDYFSAKGRTRSASGATNTAGDNDVTQAPGAGAGKVDAAGGFMGRWKTFGKSAKKSIADPSATPIPEAADQDDASKRNHPSEDPAQLERLQALRAILSQPLTPTPPNDAPPLELSPNIAIMISEEAGASGGWNIVYSGSASTLNEDVEAIEMAAPLWLLDLLLLNKSPAAPPLKISFVVIPWEKKHEPIQDSSRLTAGRVLRVRKILQYVKDKLAPIDFPNLMQPIASEMSADKAQQDAKAEDMYEVVCNDTVLPIKMTIGAIKHYVWRQGSELTMYYRRKAAP